MTYPRWLVVSCGAAAALFAAGVVALVLFQNWGAYEEAWDELNEPPVDSAPEPPDPAWPREPVVVGASLLSVALVLGCLFTLTAWISHRHQRRQEDASR